MMPCSLSKSIGSAQETAFGRAWETFRRLCQHKDHQSRSSATCLATRWRCTSMTVNRLLSLLANLRGYSCIYACSARMCTVGPEIIAKTPLVAARTDQNPVCAPTPQHQVPCDILPPARAFLRDTFRSVAIRAHGWVYTWLASLTHIKSRLT